MRRVMIDGGGIATPNDVYDAFSAQLALAPEFGRNLDALWDVLTVDVVGPLEIVWRDAARSRARLGDAFEPFAHLLRDLALVRSDVQVRIDDERAA